MDEHSDHGLSRGSPTPDEQNQHQHPLHHQRPTALNLKKDDRQTPSPISTAAHAQTNLTAALTALQSHPFYSQLMMLQHLSPGGMAPEFQQATLNLLLMNAGAATLEPNNNTSPLTVPPASTSPSAQAAAVLLMRSQVRREEKSFVFNFKGFFDFL